jgi:hypothetical protein
MKISKLPLLAAILPLAATLFLAPAQLRADTYNVVELGNANGFNVIDITPSGEVIIFAVNASDYQTWDNGLLVNTTSTLPSLTYDNGTPCSVPSGFAGVPGGKVICNNGRVGFGSTANPNLDPGGVYTGPISSPTLVGGGTVDLAVLNASGDFAWSDGILELNFEAIDLTTPEPSSLLLLGTGCISLFCVLRRKLS